MKQVALPLAVFLSAAASMFLEIAVVRLGAPYVGQSLLPWSAAIASVLLGLTAGHVLGGVVAGATMNLGSLYRRVGIVWLAAGLAASALPLLIERLADVLSGEHGFGGAAVVAFAGLAFLPSVAAGFVSPLAVRAAVLMPHLQLSRMVGVIYAASAAGSVVGTAVAGFLLLENVGAGGLVWTVSAIWVGLAIAVLPWRDLPALRAALGLIAIAAMVLMAFALSGAGPCLQESRYTCIRLYDRALADGGLLRFMILDEGVHSASDRDRPERLHLGYAVLADRLARAAFAQSHDPRALVIGGGGATLPRAWAAGAPGAEVTSIELDPVVVAAANEKMWAGSQPRLKTLIGDGRAVVRTLPKDETFDVVLMDAYRTRSVPPHLVTREFDSLIAQRMTVRGVFLSNVIDRADTPLLALSIARTLSEIFPAVDIWIAGENSGHSTNIVVAAWMDATAAHRPATEIVAASVMNAGEAVRSQDVVWRRLDFKSAAERWPQACAARLTDDWAPVDRLLAGRHVCEQ